MKSDGEKPKTIDEYIAGYPPDVRAILEKIRATIRKGAPDAEEAIKYRLPTFTLKGNLVHFGAFDTHVGFYPTASAREQFEDDLRGYEGGKGTVRLPLDKPMPLGLIGRIVAFRVKENLARAEAKQKRKTASAEPRRARADAATR